MLCACYCSTSATRSLMGVNFKNRSALSVGRRKEGGGVWHREEEGVAIGGRKKRVWRSGFLPLR